MEEERIDYDKLVRHLLIKKLEDKGLQPKFRKVTDPAEKLVYMKKKGVEEMGEFEKAKTDNERFAELVDIQQWIIDSLKLLGETREKLDAAVLEKYVERGGLDPGIVLESALKDAPN